jgi:hypothetical protein
MTSARLAALQLPNGGFESIVTSPRGRVMDCNGFTAAIVLRVTRHVPADSTLAIVRERALGYLATCAAPLVPDAFAFWPDAAHPSWAAAVPADVDDTALVLTEMRRHQWLDRAGALRRACRALLPCRVSDADAPHLPPWVATGCFYTWIDARHVYGARSAARPNVVDCCVNANVAALMAFIDARHLPGYDSAVLTVQNGVRWAVGDPKRLSAITPFYPSVENFINAVEHAVECGADALTGASHDLRMVAPDGGLEPVGCCRSAYGSTIWHCPAIDTACALARAAGHAVVNRLPAVCTAT